MLEVTSIETGPNASVDGRARWLRSIERLRSGLPPVDGLEEFTKGHANISRIANAYLQKPADLNRWLAVTGNYGEGKTHGLSLIREIALQNQFATCQLVCDAGGSALNHPQRFVANLLSTLEVSFETVASYQDLLYRVLLEPARTLQLQAIAQRYLGGRREVDDTVNFGLSRIVFIQQNPSSPHEDFLRNWNGRVVHHLIGESIRYKGATALTRDTAYSLLRIATDLLGIHGLRGLVVALDEVESLFTKLPNVRSRLGAYRTLSALCASSYLGNCRVVLAITPDAARNMDIDLRTVGEEIECLPSEPLRKWAVAYSKDLHSTIHCRPLTSGERAELLQGVWSIYRRAYPDSNGISGESWNTFKGDLTTVQVPVRLLVRRAVEFLDSLRYGGQLRQRRGLS